MPGEPWLMRVEGALEAHFEGLSAAARADNTFLGRTVMSYLDDLLRTGRNPTDERQHVITITEPPPGTLKPRKPWWKVWGKSRSQATSVRPAN
ncbi:MAG TPA: hypothetical protein VGG91_16350 [Myxococcaceae bacterium]